MVLIVDVNAMPVVMVVVLVVVAMVVVLVVAVLVLVVVVVVVVQPTAPIDPLDPARMLRSFVRQEALQSVWENEVASLNIAVIEVTWITSHVDRSWLKSLAP